MLIRLIAQAVRALLPKEGEVLVVGLGNRNVTGRRAGYPGGGADAGDPPSGGKPCPGNAGPSAGCQRHCARRAGADRHSKQAELCRGLIQRVRPAAVVAIDALAAFDSGRICSTIQITTTPALNPAAAWAITGWA